MKKLLFFPLFLFAFKLDFSACYKKYKHIYSLIPVTKTKSITFSKPSSYIYFDPFTKMYVISHKNRYPIKFYNNEKLGWFLAAINFENVYGGTFAKDMEFLSPAKLSTSVPKNTIISDMFCNAYGVGSGDGFIRGDFIKHFAKYGYWGDIGIEVDKFMRVKSIDPFYVSGIKVGDKILKINSKKANVKTFSKYVLLGHIGDKVVIKSEKKEIVLEVRKKIYNFTPLMHFGIVVDKDLNIVKLSKELFNKTYIKPPAKLIKVNSYKVKSFEELKKILSFNKNVTITVEKDGIQITIPLRR
jgi:hypothetical protein